MINENFKNAVDIIKAFPTEQSCIDHLTALRWGLNVNSPFDPLSKIYVCKQNRYRCSNTGKYFNVKTDTIFHNSKIELQKWFIAIWIVTGDTTINSVELGRDLNITQKTAWYMLQRIKKYLDIIPETTPKKAPRIKQQKTKIEELEVVTENDKLQMLEWLKLLKK